MQQVEEGRDLAPKFGPDGLIPAIASDSVSGEVLMLGHMNADAPARTLETGQSHYRSRRRQAIWREGATSGLVQQVVELRIDDDQDAVWPLVRVGGAGAGCHVGYRSCFCRTVPVGPAAAPRRLHFTAARKLFDPAAVYGDAPSPTRL